MSNLYVSYSGVYCKYDGEIPSKSDLLVKLTKTKSNLTRDDLMTILEEAIHDPAFNLIFHIMDHMEDTSKIRFQYQP